MRASDSLQLHNAFIRYQAKRKVIIMNCISKLQDLTVGYNIECNKIRQRIYKELGQ